MKTILDAFEAVPEPLAAPQHNRHDAQVQVVDQIRGQELAHRARPAADPHVIAKIVTFGSELPGCRERLGRRRVEEVEDGSVGELEGRG